MNNISADATRVTAPPALHWACDSPALPLLAVVPPSRIEPFLFSVGFSNPFHIHPMEFKNSRFAPKCAPKCWGFDRNPGCFIGKFFNISPRLRPNF